MHSDESRPPQQRFSAKAPGIDLTPAQSADGRRHDTKPPVNSLMSVPSSGALLGLSFPFGRRAGEQTLS